MVGKFRYVLYMNVDLTGGSSHLNWCSSQKHEDLTSKWL